jgi:trans-aconitate 2-methyltransferase
MSWDPATYLAFASERTRPAYELAARVPLESPRVVVDLGCGPGNSTAVLAARWPRAELIAVDSSADMLAKARASGINAEWVEADVATWTPATAVSVIYSNATFQWVDHHEAVFARLMHLLEPGGVLAVQMPRNFEAPSHVLLRQTAAEGAWAQRLEGVGRARPVAEPQDYYALLAPHARKVDIWESEYLQVLDGEDAVFRWVAGTALVPYREALDGELRERFLEAYRRRLAEAYPMRPDGRTLFPFKRIFIVATKDGTA